MGEESSHFRLKQGDEVVGTDLAFVLRPIRLGQVALGITAGEVFDALAQSASLWPNKPAPSSPSAATTPQDSPFAGETLLDFPQHSGERMTIGRVGAAHPVMLRYSEGSHVHFRKWP